MKRFFLAALALVGSLAGVHDKLMRNAPGIRGSE
jgi:hypothetical protein